MRFPSYADGNKPGVDRPGLRVAGNFAGFSNIWRGGPATRPFALLRKMHKRTRFGELNLSALRRAQAVSALTKTRRLPGFLILPIA